MRQHDDGQRPLRVGDLVCAIVDCPGGIYYRKGNVGQIVYINSYGDLQVKWSNGPGATRNRGLSFVSSQDMVRIELDSLASTGEAWKPIAVTPQHEQAEKSETNARRLLRMLHQWAVCDGRYRGGNLWREVERELS